MAALDFPASPTVGQTYSANGGTYTWDGTVWVASRGTATPHELRRDWLRLRHRA